MWLGEMVEGNAGDWMDIQFLELSLDGVKRGDLRTRKT